VDALRENPERSFLSGGFMVFPGAFGVRGEPPSSIKAGASIMELHRRFLQKLDTSLPGLVGASGTGLHALTLTIVLRKGAPIEGECRIDGQVSDALCRMVMAFDWPAPTTTYMIKQYFVLSRRSGSSKPNAGLAS
jgi:hypothetical protein